MKKIAETGLIVITITLMFAASIVDKFPDAGGFSVYSDLAAWYYSRDVVSMNAVMARLITYPAFWAASNPQTYVLVTGMILFTALAASAIVLLRLLKKFGLQRWRVLLLVVSPSFLLFAYYNIDLVGVFFVLAALYLALEQKWTTSAACLGLAIATKVFPLLYVPFVWSAQRDWKQRITYLVVASSAWLAVNLPFMLSNMSDWMLFVKVQSTWGIEDSWMIFLMPRTSPIAHYLTLILLFLGVAYLLRYRLPLERAWFCATLLFVLASSKFPCQYFLYLLPFMAMLGVSRIEGPFFVADVLNTFVIITWFIPSINGGAPMEAFSPTQWISGIRQLILFVVFVRLVHPAVPRRIARAPAFLLRRNSCGLRIHKQ